MLTVGDIHKITFTENKNWYKSGEVDLFLDQCAETVDELTKGIDSLLKQNEELTRTNESLEKKLEVLADKLVEYKNDEDNIHAALVSAQRLSDTIIREANQKAGLILEDAGIKADKLVSGTEKMINEKSQELVRAREEVSRFKAHLMSLYREHITLIGLIPDNESADVHEDTAEPVSPDVDAAIPEETAENDIDEPDTGNEHAKADEPLVVIVDETVFSNTQEEKTSSRFANLKFGDDYDISQDNDTEDGTSHIKRR